MARTITGQINRTKDTPWVGARVSFRLKTGSYTTSAQYPQDRADAITDANGNFTVNLWANAAGLLPTTYLCTLPDGSVFEFVLPVGTTPLTLSELRSLSSIPNPSPPTLIDIGDARYRLLGQPIPASEITGLVGGDGGGGLAAYPAATALSALRVVSRLGGTYAYSDPAESESVFAIAGITGQSYAQGETLTPLRDRELTDNSWNWTLGQPIVLGPNGTLTQTPAAGNLVQVAYPLTANTIFISIERPIGL